MTAGKPTAHGIRSDARAGGRAAAQRRRHARRPRRLLARIRGGDLGSLPVIVGLVVIWTVFQALNPVFLSSTQPGRTSRCSAPRSARSRSASCSCCSLGEIDLSVGSVSGLAAAILAVSFVQLQWNLVLALIAAIAVGCLVGLLYGFLYTRFGRAELRHHARRTAGIPRASALGARRHRIDQPPVRLVDRAVRPADVTCRPGRRTSCVVLAVGRVRVDRSLRRARRRAAANLVSQSYREIALRSGALLVVPARRRLVPQPLARRRRHVPVLPRARRHHELRADPHALGPRGLCGRRLGRGGPSRRHPRGPHLHLGLRAVLDARRRRRHPGGGAARRRRIRAPAAATSTSTPSRRPSSAGRACSAAAARRSRRCSASSSSSRSRRA